MPKTYVFLAFLILWLPQYKAQFTIALYNGKCYIMVNLGINESSFKYVFEVPFLMYVFHSLTYSLTYSTYFKVQLRSTCISPNLTYYRHVETNVLCYLNMLKIHGSSLMLRNTNTKNPQRSLTSPYKRSDLLGTFPCHVYCNYTTPYTTLYHI